MLKASIRPRLDDIGPAGHVHNTVLPAWFQQARQELLDVFRNVAPAVSSSLMIKEYTITFHRELVLMPNVEVTIHVERVGNSSFILDEQAFQDGELSAESRVVYVHVGQDGRPAPLTDDHKAYLLQHQPDAEMAALVS